MKSLFSSVCGSRCSDEIREHLPQVRVIYCSFRQFKWYFSLLLPANPTIKNLFQLTWFWTTIFREYS